MPIARVPGGAKAISDWGMRLVRTFDMLAIAEDNSVIKQAATETWR